MSYYTPDVGALLNQEDSGGSPIISNNEYTLTISGATASNTATITAVDTNKAVVIPQGVRSDSANAGHNDVRLALTDSTTVTGTRDDSTSATTTVVFRVVEERRIKSIQRGTIAITSSNASNTATVTAVDVTKCTIVHLGTDSANADDRVTLSLTNSTTITATRASTGGTATVGYQLVEYY